MTTPTVTYPCSSPAAYLSQANLPEKGGTRS